MRLDQSVGLPELHRQVPATADQIRTLRHLLTGWAEHTGLSPAQINDLEIAAYEAMANVACHAYPDPGAGLVELHATQKDGHVHVTVVDHGRWNPPPADPGPRHGRGLPLIQNLTTHVRIDNTEHGTTVEMDWPCLNAPARTPTTDT